MVASLLTRLCTTPSPGHLRIAHSEDVKRKVARLSHVTSVLVTQNSLEHTAARVVLLLRLCCTRHLLWTKETQLHQKTLHQKTLRARIPTWRCTSRSLEAELHQQALRLLWRRRWSCHLIWSWRTQDPASEDSASSDSGLALYFTNLGGRASPAGFATAETSAPSFSLSLSLSNKQPLFHGRLLSSRSTTLLCLTFLFPLFLRTLTISARAFV